MESNDGRSEGLDESNVSEPAKTGTERVEQMFAAAPYAWSRRRPHRRDVPRQKRNPKPRNLFRTWRRIRRVAAYAVTIALIAGNFYFLVLRPEANWWFVKHPFDGPFLRAKTVEATPDVDAAFVVERRMLEGDVATAIDMISKDELFFFRAHAGASASRMKLRFEVWRDGERVQESPITESTIKGGKSVVIAFSAPRSCESDADFRIPYRLNFTHEPTPASATQDSMRLTTSSMSGFVAPRLAETGPLDVSGIRTTRYTTQFTHPAAIPAAHAELFCLAYGKTELRVIVEAEFSSTKE
jgi:hypothetical protein